MLLAKQDTEDMDGPKGRCENNDRYVQGGRVGSVMEGQLTGNKTDQRMYVSQVRRVGTGHSKTGKQERTINPDTRLHSDEMRESDEKERRLARNPRKRTSLESSCLRNWRIDKCCPVVICGWRGCQYPEEVAELKGRCLLFIHT